jgi:hypothetical protein
MHDRPPTDPDAKRDHERELSPNSVFHESSCGWSHPKLFAKFRK